MRTTIRLDEHLLAEAKAYAARHNASLNSVMEEALRRMLMSVQEQRESAPFRFQVHQGEARGLQPGVDLDNNAALLDLMTDAEAEDAGAADVEAAREAALCETV